MPDTDDPTEITAQDLEMAARLRGKQSPALQRTKSKVFKQIEKERDAEMNEKIDSLKKENEKESPDQTFEPND